VVLRRKFDIRQWVLITDFNPLVIWLYDECYIRFSAIDYDPKEVSNKFIHLTNNSIAAYSKEFDSSHIKGNMFFQSEFEQFLKETTGKDVFQDVSLNRFRPFGHRLRKL
jgi:tubulin monoglycylase TTLL3/8